MKSHIVKGNAKSKLFREEFLGEENELIAKVRATLQIDDVLLPDSIILAPLHADTARMLSDDINPQTSKIKATYGNYKYCVFNHFIGAICHALSSRVKDKRYEAYRNTNWLELSREYHEKANAIINAYAVQAVQAKYGK
jgi:hypothetical protein